MKGHEWSEAEVGALVRDYFAMMGEQVAGRPYSKTDHRRDLIQQLDGRSDSSIEFKHRNVSAVLEQMGLTHLRGYKPAANFQMRLIEAVDHYLMDHHDLHRAIVRDSRTAEATRVL